MRAPDHTHNDVPCELPWHQCTRSGIVMAPGVPEPTVRGQSSQSILDAARAAGRMMAQEPSTRSCCESLTGRAHKPDCAKAPTFADPAALVEEIREPRSYLGTAEHPRTYRVTSAAPSHGILQVEVGLDGRVAAVWLGCQMLPFEQINVNAKRANEVDVGNYQLPLIHGIELEDRRGSAQEGIQGQGGSSGGGQPTGQPSS